MRWLTWEVKIAKLIEFGLRQPSSRFRNVAHLVTRLAPILKMSPSLLPPPQARPWRSISQTIKSQLPFHFHLLTSRAREPGTYFKLFERHPMLNCIQYRLVIFDEIVENSTSKCNSRLKNQAAFRVRQKPPVAVLNPKRILRGLKFSRFSTADSCLCCHHTQICLWAHIAGRPLLFSFCPRSHALYGCQSTPARSSAATRSCSTNSLYHCQL